LKTLGREAHGQATNGGEVLSGTMRFPYSQSRGGAWGACLANSFSQPCIFPRSRSKGLDGYGRRDHSRAASISPQNIGKCGSVPVRRIHRPLRRAGTRSWSNTEFGRRAARITTLIPPHAATENPRRRAVPISQDGRFFDRDRNGGRSLHVVNRARLTLKTDNGAKKPRRRWWRCWRGEIEADHFNQKSPIDSRGRQTGSDRRGERAEDRRAA